jgi:hypothetical protein
VERDEVRPHTSRNRTTKRFDQAMTAIEARAPVVVQETNHICSVEIPSKPSTPAQWAAKQVEAKLGFSGFMLLMKIEQDLLMGELDREHRSVQFTLGNPLIVKDGSDAAPKLCRYTPRRIAVLENERDGSARILFDSPKSLMGSFGSAAARKNRQFPRPNVD